MTADRAIGADDVCLANVSVPGCATDFFQVVGNITPIFVNKRGLVVNPTENINRVGLWRYLQDIASHQFKVMRQTAETIKLA